MITKNVIAVEQDGLNYRVLTIPLEVPSFDFDIETAVRAASTDFCKTEEGNMIYRYNHCCFDWADFEVNVPNSFCKKYGFRKADEILPDFVVDMNEHLVDDYELNEDGEQI